MAMLFAALTARGAGRRAPLATNLGGRSRGRNLLRERSSAAARRTVFQVPRSAKAARRAAARSPDAVPARGRVGAGDHAGQAGRKPADRRDQLPLAGDATKGQARRSRDRHAHSLGAIGAPWPTCRSRPARRPVRSDRESPTKIVAGGPFSRLRSVTPTRIAQMAGRRQPRCDRFYRRKARARPGSRPLRRKPREAAAYPPSVEFRSVGLPPIARGGRSVCRR